MRIDIVRSIIPQGNHNEIIVDHYTRADFSNTLPKGNHDRAYIPWPPTDDVINTIPQGNHI